MTNIYLPFKRKNTTYLNLISRLKLSNYFPYSKLGYPSSNPGLPSFETLIFLLNKVQSGGRLTYTLIEFGLKTTTS